MLFRSRDNDQLRAESLAEQKPKLKIRNALCVLAGVEQALIMHEGLEAEDSEAAGDAHGAGLGGGMEEVGVSWAARNGFGEMFEVFVEEFYAGKVVGCGLVEFGL